MIFYRDSKSKKIKMFFFFLFFVFFLFLFLCWGGAVVGEGAIVREEGVGYG